MILVCRKIDPMTSAAPVEIFIRFAFSKHTMQVVRMTCFIYLFMGETISLYNDDAAIFFFFFFFFFFSLLKKTNTLPEHFFPENIA